MVMKTREISHVGVQGLERTKVIPVVGQSGGRGEILLLVQSCHLLRFHCDTHY